MSRFGQSFSSLGIADRKKDISSVLEELIADLNEEPVNRELNDSKGGGREKDPKFNCDQCGRQYVLERNLKKHLSDKHPPEMSSNKTTSSSAAEHTALNEEFSRIDQFELNLCTQQAFSNKTNDSITYEIINNSNLRSETSGNNLSNACNGDVRLESSEESTIESNVGQRREAIERVTRRTPVKRASREQGSRGTSMGTEKPSDESLRVLHPQQISKQGSTSYGTSKQSDVQKLNSGSDANTNQAMITHQSSEQRDGSTAMQSIENISGASGVTAAAVQSKNQSNKKEAERGRNVNASVEVEYLSKLKEEISELLKQFKDSIAMSSCAADKGLVLVEQSVQVPNSPLRPTRTVKLQTTPEMHDKSVSASNESTSIACQTSELACNSTGTSTTGQKWGIDVEVQVASDTVNCETMTDCDEVMVVNSKMQASPPHSKPRDERENERLPTLTQQFMADEAPGYLAEMQTEQQFNECELNESFFMDSLRTNNEGAQNIASTQQNSPTFSSSKGSATDQAADVAVYDISFLQTQSEAAQPTKTRSESQSSSPSTKAKQSALKKFRQQVSAKANTTTGCTLRKIPSKGRKRTHACDDSSSNDSGGKRTKISIFEDGKSQNVDEIACSLELALINEEKEKERVDPQTEIIELAEAEKKNVNIANGGEVASLGDSLFASSLLLLGDEDINNDIVELEKESSVEMKSRMSTHGAASTEEENLAIDKNRVEEVVCGITTQVTTKELTSQTGKVVRNQTPYERDNGELIEEQVQGEPNEVQHPTPKKKKQQKQRNSSEVPVVSELLDGVVVAISSLDSPEVSTVRKICVKLGGHFRKELTEKTTHLVIRKADVGKGERVVQRTQKYLEAIARGIWIVEYEWIEECAHLGKRAKEEDYEILGDVVCGIEHRGPARARTRAENGGTPMLSKCAVHCPAEFMDMGVEVIERLVKSAGGTWVSSRQHFKQQDCGGVGGAIRRRVLLVDCEISSSVKKIADECNLPLISREWLLDSLCQARLLSRKEYIVYSTTQQHYDLEKTLSHG
ncbi:uncharacterized protein LOC142339521 isoform X2 [Convolutriloba macropyga]|uniref:uncharacterized protein LOC142339521 isoform X2 n=1 Tax=Convolutriloba macropyga TaxID=536237 RepID=UPI003F525B0A